MSNEQNNETPAQSSNQAVARMSDLSSGVGIMSTFKGDTQAEKIATLKAVTSAKSLGDHIGEVINLAHVVTQAVSIVDDVTKEEKDVVRVVLIDADGSSYAAVSDGIMGSLRDIFGVLGNPNTWAEPLPVTVAEVKGRRGFKFFKIEVV